ncbi:diguanylate cyclase [Verminephrobacter aporrectodeae subsp. tuberculatae]|uniref:bifunctional diguanylate cyclase/phosphodiesterase n=1 Tax=Verminephrobacter aporrectodeae TaxID=1110389 RepID=UPI0022388885|nr:diguanylate cyclase [Verminephrobacter aporrectodeae]MCW5223424.1 diguanylate cyclase [Verminephrobacter aporrectodeae subsp. tuberculatae]MCW5288888.1 diguanylate cyclase [Verminephrobacter aporrectodeae subsp. tuberculatae]
MRPFPHRLIWLALLVSLGIGALFAHAIWTIRSDKWDYARQTNDSLARTLGHGLSGSLESYDKSIDGVAREVSRPDVWALPPALRARVVFDHSPHTRGVSDILVLDARGDAVLDSASLSARKVNFADREFFLAFKSGGHKGLYIGKSTLSRLSDQNILPMARAYHHPDGSFAGVVSGVLFLRYLDELFGTLNLGSDSEVTLFRLDGTVIARFPHENANPGHPAADPVMLAHFQAQNSGSFVDAAPSNGVQHLHSFLRLGDYPLVLDVAQSTQTIAARWYRSALVLGAFTALLMAGCVGLALLFVRELRLRQQVSARLHEAEHDLRTILNNMPSMIGYWDHLLRLRFVNQAYVAWFGMQPEKLRGMHASELLGEALFGQDRPFLERALHGEPQLFERTLTDGRGQTRHTLASYLPDPEPGSGRIRGIFVQITDISERKRMENELFDEKERMRLTLQSIGDAVVCTDAKGHVSYLNPVAERLTGWSCGDASGRDVDAVVSLRSPDGARIRRLHTVIEERTDLGLMRGVVVHRKTGQRFTVEETASPITDRQGCVTGAVAVLRDVTQTVAMSERMAHLAQHDALTDLPNRVLLQDRAQLAIAQARRDGRSLAVMYLDLDGFKQVNDSLGHAVGDLLLVQVARRLKASVRASDTVCRQGGDEFAVLLPGLDGEAPACAVARKILASCEGTFDLAGQPLRIGVSGGIALYPQHGDSFDTLSRHADSAMYVAKRGGRMRFMLYQGPGAEPLSVLADAAPPAASNAGSA